jgi:hypothetical protein
MVFYAEGGSACAASADAIRGIPAVSIPYPEFRKE